MTHGERVREIRKNLGLTLDKFGERIGIKKSALSLIENGKTNLTDANIKAICREFSVDYIWLTTGEGEMFVDSDGDFAERIDRIMAGENNARKSMIKSLINASEDDIQVLCRLINDSYNLMNRNDESVEDAEAAYKKSRSDIVQNTDLPVSSTIDDTGKNKSAAG